VNVDFKAFKSERRTRSITEVATGRLIFILLQATLIAFSGKQAAGLVPCLTFASGPLRQAQTLPVKGKDNESGSPFAAPATGSTHEERNQDNDWYRYTEEKK
jgi:hypothetical protein